MYTHSLHDALPILSAWHGFNTEVWMTIGVIILGTFIYMFLRYWKSVYKLFPTNLTLDNLYNHTQEQMEKGSAVFTSFYMTGSLRRSEERRVGKEDRYQWCV